MSKDKEGQEVDIQYQALVDTLQDKLDDIKRNMSGKPESTNRCSEQNNEACVHHHALRNLNSSSVSQLQEHQPVSSR